jgi:hypothetical protein
MSLAEFVALLGGVLTQLGLFLTNEGKDPFAFAKKKEKEENALIDAPVSHQQQVLLFGSIALLSSILLDQFALGQARLGWVDDLFNFVIAGILAFVLFSALAGDQMLPKVNEQQMLVVHLVVGINMLISGEPALPKWGLLLLLIPTTALIFQGIWSRPLHLIQRAFFYLWYLITLLVLAFQNGGYAYFETIELSMPEMFIFASLLIFLGLHILVAMRFVLIISSLILPRNRPLLKIIMPRLMHDEQLPLLNLFIILAFAGLILLLNYVGNLDINQTLVNLFILALLQLPEKISLYKKN